ncbi:hypothetical protein UFOVP112_78 [uncultured Caudovirales phage]|uniref:Uncharacterized protein n=1 Tax=uncultured Caudovirales phage TaxID=2100421 RepID=A0A6J5L6C5_9CAUD|nr:hypothetical protein UFOVP112_78 [uncultured Caudovirales phage]
MLKHNEVNPLAVFGLRELSHQPPHFTPVEFDLKTADKVILDWIWSNLTGRFWFGDYYSKDDNNHVVLQKCASFEIPGEASMFALILDQINRPGDFW